MEGPAQKIRRFARDLCPGKPLGIIQIQVNVVSLDSNCIKVHPDGTGERLRCPQGIVSMPRKVAPFYGSPVRLINRFIC